MVLRPLSPSMHQAMVATSAYVFSSASSATISQFNAAKLIHGSVAISHDGVSLDVSYHLSRGGLCIFVRGFDLADPEVTLVRQRLMLQPGERRLMIVPRGGNRQAVCFIFCRVGDGMQILTGGTWA